MKRKCPFCGHDNIQGSDRCDNCKRFLTHEDLPVAGRDKIQKLVMTERVGDFISKIPPITVGPETSLKEVVERMQALPMKGCVLICGPDGRLQGIVSVRDILLKVAGRVPDKDLASTPVRSIMTPNPECLDREAPLSFALHKMSVGRFRHVPVLDKGLPVGVVSTRDVIEYFCKGAGAKSSG